MVAKGYYKTEGIVWWQGILQDGRGSKYGGKGYYKMGGIVWWQGIS